MCSCFVRLLVHVSNTALSLRDLIVDGAWNLSGLYTMLPSSIVEALLSLSPSLDAHLLDAWVWSPNRAGVYTAATAYQWLLQQRGLVVTGGDWQWLWKIRASEKVRVLIWFILHDALQVNSVRFRCHLAASPQCSRCSHPVEDVLHCLRDCLHSHEIWLHLQAFGWPQFNVSEVVTWIQSQVRGPHSTLFVSALWGLWRCWNERVLGEAKWTLHYTYSWIWNEEKEYDQYLAKSQERILGPLQIDRWKPPASAFVSLTIDGAYDHTQRRMGMGGVVRDQHGVWQFGFCAGMLEGDPLAAELSALRLQECASMFMDIHLLLARQWDIRLRHISREANGPADCLTGYGASQQCAFTYFDNPSDIVVPLLSQDVLTL
ncbi:uncharacterized protein LOC130743901 [Lotus japonicus]|uniref:uncharacterized protein LOC130743901 n=1 Tax=Lotus japonicus TaxID=34305 RepID=UPI002590CBF3|nr:uncharacterized protein LOC130743901 [Lotus japonicus]